MPPRTFTTVEAIIAQVPATQTVLIAGPTASGKSAIALALAKAQGGVIVNADASQVYACWRVLTARPTKAEESQIAHRLYGHVPADHAYSVGHWLRDIRALMSTKARLIVVGGTGLYFKALTEGLADIPSTPPHTRRAANKMSLAQLLAALDAETCAAIDTCNRARVQRAWEVHQTTGKSLLYWQRQTAPADLPLDRCFPLVVHAPRDWLNARIAQRFELMLAQGALEEARQVSAVYDPNLPAHRAIGGPELIAYTRGQQSLDDARQATIIATRRLAKRQRTWMRSHMSKWHAFTV
ncbi:MAG: tRNA (adenosine(37)-N6)-dimethylallyltransferase MiaA [Pseudomonadota bacterium]